MIPFSARALLFSSAVLFTLPSQSANWTNQGYSVGIDGFNPTERTISANNVQNLALAWQSNTSDINSVYAMAEDNGTVFVLSQDSSQNFDLVALNGSTGAELWKTLTGFPQGFVGTTGLAAAAGRVFTPCGNNPTNTEEGLCGYSQQTGNALWFDNFLAQNVSKIGNIARPTYAGGIVYVGHDMCDNDIPNCDNFYAINAKTGGIIWGTSPPAFEVDGGYGAASPAVSANGGLMAAPCAYVFDGNVEKSFSGLCTFSLSNGSGGWQAGEVNTTNGQEGASGVSISGNTVFFQQSYVDLNENVLTAFAAPTGNQDWTFDSVFSFHDAVQPTVAKGVVYWPDGNGTLWALKEKTGATLWSFSDWGTGCSPVNGPNGTESQPQVADGVVFITTSCSVLGGNFTTVSALAATNGTLLWQGSAGSTLVGGAAPMIVDGTLYAECSPQVCAWTLPSGHALDPNTR